MKSPSSFVIALVAVLIVGALGANALLRKTVSTGAVSSIESNVAVVDGNQIVSIDVKGGYRPQVSSVKPGMPVVLRFKTAGTFDCTSTIRIPTLGISKTLPSSGATDVVLGSLPVGTVEGTCGMGMYRFTLVVKG